MNLLLPLGKFWFFVALMSFGIPSWAQKIDLPNSKIEQVFEFTRQIYSKQISRKIINDSFKQFLVEGQKELTETQLIKFLVDHPEIWPEIENYLKEVQAAEESHLARVQEVVQKFEQRFKIVVEGEWVSRLNVRALRGQTPEAAISRYLKAQGVEASQIETAIGELKTLKEQLEESLSPIRKKYTEQFKVFLADPNVVSGFQKYADPLSVLELSLQGSQPDFEVVEYYVNHPIKNRQGRWVGQDDIEKKGYLGIIQRAQYEIAGNVFETNLPSLGEALAARTDLQERLWGVDQKMYDTRPEVQKVIQTMVDGGVTATLVATSKLNHQKMVAIDYRHEGKGYVFLSTGNATQSCVGAGGDLHQLNPVPPQSKPNANLATLIKSDVLASIVHHEVAKSVDPNLLFKGADFPVSGSYRIKGKNGATLEIAFTPNGANNNLAKNFLVPELKQLKFPYIGGALFAFSSVELADAIFETYMRFKAEGKRLQAQITIDKPFAMQVWSMGLALTGLKRIGTRAENNIQYVEDPESPWVKNLTADELKEWRRGIRIASPDFQDGVVEVEGQKFPYSVKLHEKLLFFGDPRDPKNAVVSVASYNPSANAEGNQEYNAKFKGEPKMHEVAVGTVKYHHAQSRLSIVEEASRRNRFQDFGDDLDSDQEFPKFKEEIAQKGVVSQSRSLVRSKSELKTAESCEQIYASGGVTLLKP